ncbi:hypothetical protein N0V93_002792 [Gnomoniopsis smithogilvyi]|uniref:Laccase n=1 Tax=Gnomoniopsis smithogilvyi TaxID=1191159 RepID=A0A9W8YX47_9PEZI|nr:hypothetical protein N0V93_002792 [Gnomoniopsis smithogilvyi]
MADGASNRTEHRPKPTFLKNTIISTCLFLFIATVLLTSVLPGRPPPDFRRSKLVQDAGKLEELDQVLHPKEHRYRETTTFYHEWTITRSSHRPDGVLKDIYLVNGVFPGPVLEARSGDTLIINVANQLTQDQGLSIHWHGLHMRGQNQYDGAVGFTQNPISPGANFTYEITIAEDQWGTFWYHAHDQVQRADGLFGAFIVHRPSEKGMEIFEDDTSFSELEDRVLLVGDWYHRSATDVLTRYMRPGSFGNEPVPDSLLVNGRGAYNCSMAVPARPVDCEQRQGLTVPKLSLHVGKQYRFRVVNHGSLAGFSIGTNFANIIVIAVDGGNEVSQGAEGSSVGILYPGQRMDILMTPESLAPAGGDEAPSLTITLDHENFKYPNPALGSQGIQRFPINMSIATDSSMSTHLSTAYVPEHIDLDSLTASSPSKLPENADMTLVLYTATQKLSHLHNIPHGFINETSWSPQANPSGPLIRLPREQWDVNQFVPKIDFEAFSGGQGGRWVDLVVNNLDDGGHPFHLHGHDVYVISSDRADRGWGSYNPFSAEKGPGLAYNLLNPVKRDTFFVPRRGYSVVRFEADNQGIWMFHCHLIWHQASGMVMGFEIA